MSSNRSDVGVAAFVALGVLAVVIGIVALVYVNVTATTERQKSCTEAGGSWTNGDQCLRFVEPVKQ